MLGIIVLISNLISSTGHATELDTATFLLNMRAKEYLLLVPDPDGCVEPSSMCRCRCHPIGVSGDDPVATALDA